MQIRKNLYQISGSLNGVTWTGTDANYEDANAYLLDTGEGGHGLIYFHQPRRRVEEALAQALSLWR